MCEAMAHEFFEVGDERHRHGDRREPRGRGRPRRQGRGGVLPGLRAQPDRLTAPTTRRPHRSGEGASSRGDGHPPAAPNRCRRGGCGGTRRPAGAVGPPAAVGGAPEAARSRSTAGRSCPRRGSGARSPGSLPGEGSRRPRAPGRRTATGRVRWRPARRPGACRCPGRRARAGHHDGSLRRHESRPGGPSPRVPGRTGSAGGSRGRTPPRSPDRRPPVSPGPVAVPAGLPRLLRARRPPRSAATRSAARRRRCAGRADPPPPAGPAPFRPAGGVRRRGSRAGAAAPTLRSACGRAMPGRRRPGCRRNRRRSGRAHGSSVRTPRLGRRCRPTRSPPCRRRPPGCRRSRECPTPSVPRSPRAGPRSRRRRTRPGRERAASGRGPCVGGARPRRGGAWRCGRRAGSPAVAARPPCG